MITHGMIEAQLPEHILSDIEEHMPWDLFVVSTSLKDEPMCFMDEDTLEDLDLFEALGPNQWR